MTDLYRFAQTKQMGLTTCSPLINNSEHGADATSAFWGSLCIDFEPLGDIDAYYNHLEEVHAAFDIYQRDDDDSFLKAQLAKLQAHNKLSDTTTTFSQNMELVDIANQIAAGSLKG